MAKMDEPTRLLVGYAVWHAIRWMEAHTGGEPYEIFSDSSDAEKVGYRVTIERIPYQAPVALG